jgi:hypothetical protein
MPSLVELMFWPLRSILGGAGRDVHELEDTDREILGGVEAIRHATTSIEHQVEVIGVLATSVGPLTESVDRLTSAMQDLVKLLGPMAAAEHGVQTAERDVERAEHFFGFRRHQRTAESSADESE